MRRTPQQKPIPLRLTPDQAEQDARRRAALKALRETMRHMTDDALWTLIASEAQRRIDEARDQPEAAHSVLRAGERIARIGWKSLPARGNK